MSRLVRRGSPFLIGLFAAITVLLLVTAAAVPEVRWLALAFALLSLLSTWSQMLVRRRGARSKTQAGTHGDGASPLG